MSSGQIIATSHDQKPPKGRECFLFQAKLGWWNIIVWPDVRIILGYLPLSLFCLEEKDGGFAGNNIIVFFHLTTMSCTFSWKNKELLMSFATKQDTYTTHVGFSWTAAEAEKATKPHPVTLQLGECDVTGGWVPSSPRWDQLFIGCLVFSPCYLGGGQAVNNRQVAENLILPLSDRLEGGQGPVVTFPLWGDRLDPKRLLKKNS